MKAAKRPHLLRGISQAAHEKRKHGENFNYYKSARSMATMVHEQQCPNDGAEGAKDVAKWQTIKQCVFHFNCTRIYECKESDAPQSRELKNAAVSSIQKRDLGAYLQHEMAIIEGGAGNGKAVQLYKRGFGRSLGNFVKGMFAVGSFVVAFSFAALAISLWVGAGLLGGGAGIAAVSLLAVPAVVTAAIFFLIGIGFVQWTK
jgi:hypothetical protein